MQKTVETGKTGISDEIDVSFVEQGSRLYFADDKDERMVYVVTVSYKGKSAKFTYGTSLADSYDHIKPKKSYILETIVSDFYYTKDYYPTYEDFAKEFGYDEDSIKGLGIYKKCLIQGEKIHRVFSEDDIKILSEEVNNA